MYHTLATAVLVSSTSSLRLAYSGAASSPRSMVLICLHIGQLDDRYIPLQHAAEHDRAPHIGADLDWLQLTPSIG